MSVDGRDGGGLQSQAGAATSGAGQGGQGVQGVLPMRVLRLVGDMDIAMAGLLRRRFLSYISATGAPVVVVDLSGVSFMDCAGLEPLCSADRWLARRGRRLVLRAASGPVEFLFTALSRAGLDPLFERAAGAELAQLEKGSDEVVENPGPPNDAEPSAVMTPGEAADEVAAMEGERLRRAVDGQPLIDQATGLLMGVHGCAAAEARVLLTRVAHEHAITIDDLADGLAGLAAARGGRASLNLSPAMKRAVRSVLAHPEPSPDTAPGAE